MNIEEIILNKRSQSQKIACSMIPSILHSQKDKTTKSKKTKL